MLPPSIRDGLEQSNDFTYATSCRRLSTYSCQSVDFHKWRFSAIRFPQSMKQKTIDSKLRQLSSWHSLGFGLLCFLDENIMNGEALFFDMLSKAFMAVGRGDLMERSNGDESSLINPVDNIF